MTEERRAKVNGAPHGTISWEEHLKAWETYHNYHFGQSAEEINKRGGFGLVELTSQLGHVPHTWLPDERTSRHYFPKGEKAARRSIRNIHNELSDIVTVVPTGGRAANGIMLIVDQGEDYHAEVFLSPAQVVEFIAALEDNNG